MIITYNCTVDFVKTFCMSYWKVSLSSLALVIDLYIKPFSIAFSGKSGVEIFPEALVAQFIFCNIRLKNMI